MSSNTTPDFRGEDPVWVRYAECIGGSHDKFYEVRADMGDDGTFYVTKRWGRRPDAGGGQIKVEPYQMMSTAISVATNMLAEKVAKGYVETDRPHGASNRVVHEYGPDWYAEDTEAF